MSGKPEDTSTLSSLMLPIHYGIELLAQYGWWLVGSAVLVLWLAQRFRPSLHKWQQAREDAAYHKDPDKVLARMEAERRARELQQQKLAAASEAALLLKKEREEKKRAEAVERLAKYGAGADQGNRLGTTNDDGYLPLSGGPSGSSYRAPKRSACSGGGCGR